MSVSLLNPPAPTRRLTSTDDLVDALQIPFSEQQLAAITAPLEPGVIIAGAGSGKTTVMAARVVWLVGTGQVRPEEVLGLTFTRKAAAELSARVRAGLLTAGVVSDRGVDESGEQLIMTYDAFAARLVSEHGLRLGYEADPTMISGATRYRLASRVVKAAAGPFEFLSRLRPATVTERVLKLDGDLQQHLVATGTLDAHAREMVTGWQSAPLNRNGNVYVDVKKAVIAAQERLELASLVEDYQALKRRLGLVEFADQMAIAARLASEVPQVSASLRAAYRVVLLDEYQDTSAAQAIMLSQLFSGTVASNGLGHPVTAVGDPFQAIYGWRGAAASNIIGFATTFRRSDHTPARQFALTVNRRSGQTILDLANVLSRPLRGATAGMAPDGSRPDGSRGTQPEGTRAGAGTDAEAGARVGKAQPGSVQTEAAGAEGAGAEGAGAGGPGADGAGAGEPAPGDGLGLLRAPAGTRPGTVRAATFDTWPEEIRWIGDQIVAVHTGGQAPRWADIAVLTRRNADIAPLYAELTAREVPVEIVGLGGLLHLPEVMDVTATLRLVNDVTANPDLIRLLSGPRWQVGPRDLALLGRRARTLAQEGTGHSRQAGEGADPSDEDPDVLAALSGAVAGVDPTEVVSLLDALESPGEEPYSDAARDRFTRLAAELAYLRRHSDEPLLDLTRRIIVTLGLDVELMATREFEQTSRRDQLGAFLDAVASYVDVDGDASLTGLLAYFQAEIDQGAGLEQAVPSDREAVKLLTVHKAKGLEWEAVFLPALMKGVFPSDRVTDNWVTTPAALPADLRGDADAIPQLADTTNAALADYKAELTRQQLLAEDRLAYVAATRARQLLVGSGHYWRADLTRPRTPSTYLTALLAEASRQGEVAAEAVPSGPDNPLVTAAAPQPWPKPLDPDAFARRQEAALAVDQARMRHAQTGSYEPAGGAEQLLLDAEEVVAGWDSDIDRLLAELVESRSGEHQVLLPDTLSASAVLRLAEDADGFAADLARPMPRPPSRAARFGTRFHQWVEHYFGPRLGTGGLGQQQLVDPDDLPDRVDAGSEDEADLRGLCEAFAAGRYGASTPYAVETPFSLLIGGRLVRGRIDAVYRLTEAAADPDAAADTDTFTDTDTDTDREADLSTGADLDTSAGGPRDISADAGFLPNADVDPDAPGPADADPATRGSTDADPATPGRALSASEAPDSRPADRSRPQPRWQVVDWKTGRADSADPLQLAIYRLAWAEVQQVPVEQVDAVFYHVRGDRVVRPEHLPDRDALARLIR